MQALKSRVIVGIINGLYVETFKKSRKLALAILKDFGFGQTVMEDRILIEVLMGICLLKLFGP